MYRHGKSPLVGNVSDGKSPGLFQALFSQSSMARYYTWVQKNAPGGAMAQEEPCAWGKSFWPHRFAGLRQVVAGDRRFVAGEFSAIVAVKFPPLA